MRKLTKKQREKLAYSHQVFYNETGTHITIEIDNAIRKILGYEIPSNSVRMWKIKL